MSDIPATVLRQAAARLRETGAACEPSVISLRGVPWHVEAGQWGRRPAVLQGGQYTADHAQPVRYVADAETSELAAWIALMHPGLAEPLAAWLEAADLHEPVICEKHEGCKPLGCQRCAEEDWPCADARRAVAVARIILGTTKETTS